MRKTKRRAKLLLVLLLLFISVGYAILQTNLNITGVAGISNANWDIHWENVQVTTGSVTGTNVTTPATIDNVKTTVNYNIKLNKPGDFYEFTVDAVNDGSIDAMIDTISSKMNCSAITTLPDYLDYSVTYYDGAQIKANQELKADTSETYKVRVEFKKDIEASQLPTSAVEISLEFTVTYKQANGSEIKVVDPVSFSTDDWQTIVSAVIRGETDNYNVGDTKEVDIGTFGTDTLRIANKSTPSECSTAGFSQTACGFVLEFADVIIKRTMNGTKTNVGGWPATAMRTYINNDIYNFLPTDLKKGIISTTVVSGHGSTSGETDFTSFDKLYLLNYKEINIDSSNDSSNNKTRTLDYYIDASSTTRYKTYNGSSSRWWLRSSAVSYNTEFTSVNSGGATSYSGATDTDGVSPAFRIG